MQRCIHIAIYTVLNICKIKIKVRLGYTSNAEVYTYCDIYCSKHLQN